MARPGFKGKLFFLQKNFKHQIREWTRPSLSPSNRVTSQETALEDSVQATLHGLGAEGLGGLY